MNPIASEIQFRGYRVLNARYSVNNAKIEKGQKIKLEPSFMRQIQSKGNDLYSLTLGVEVGSESDDGSLPFFAKVEMEGLFRVPESDNVNTIMEVNGTAILFPYLRSTLTMLTSVANITPVILPTINLARMFDESQKKETDKEPEGE